MMPVEAASGGKLGRSNLEFQGYAWCQQLWSPGEGLNVTKNLQNWLKGFPFVPFQRCIKWSVAAPSVSRGNTHMSQDQGQ